ncbi:toprim domain-containing protein [Chitinophaga barathri]|uniref:DNA primase n=1 Tax=Chitinophaga barathri TaxID=1647451 RepID=A0A3N4MC70_9BACT|nr:toprim domain-containing protein [Chitinophaga barathri]RPD41281.1 DNA primase [Chitinophaga barathri]
MRLTFEEAKRIDLVDYLASLGHTPQKVRGTDHWYLSPLRDEKTASFKVDRKLNLWFDHGNGKGGSIIDFGVAYFGCGIAEFMDRLGNGFSFHRQQPAAGRGTMISISAEADEKKKIHLLSEHEIVSPALIQYLAARNIPLELARQYCREVRFELNERSYYAIGFRNDQGGFELRNAQFKGSSSPKFFTFIRTAGTELSIFEGCFDFLSYLVIRAQQSLPETNYLILNSLSAFEASLPFMQQFPRINLYLDHDNAGRTLTSHAIKQSPAFHDGSGLYAGAKDLNEWHVQNAARIAREVRARSPGHSSAEDHPPTGKKIRR